MKVILTLTHVNLSETMRGFRAMTPSAEWHSSAADLEHLWPFIAPHCKNVELLDVGCGDAALWTNLDTTTISAVYGVDLLGSKSWPTLKKKFGSRVEFFMGSLAVLKQGANVRFQPTVALVKNVLPWLSWSRIRELMFSLPPSIEKVFFVDRVDTEKSITAPAPRAFNLVRPPMNLKMVDHTYFYDVRTTAWSICLTTDVAAWRVRQDQHSQWEPCPDCETDREPLYTVSDDHEYQFQCSLCNGTFSAKGEQSNDNTARSLWNNRVRSVYNIYRD